MSNANDEANSPNAKTVEVADTAPPSKVRTVLTQARRDLWNAQPLFLTSLFNPLRDFVFDPALAISSILLPALLGERSDAVLASCLKLAILPMKAIYSHLPHEAAPAPADDNIRSVARNTILHRGGPPAGADRGPKFQPPSDLRSAFQGAVSFAVSAIGDMVGVMTNPKKMKKWLDALGQLKAYLDASGVGDELEEAMMKPMLRGRLLDNLKILNDIQEKNDADRCVKAKCCDVDDIRDDIREGHRIMRFATASYGCEMIKSAIDIEVDPKDLQDHQTAIAKHTGISPEDIRLMYVKDADDEHILYHFVAIDHKSKSVILSLRGTLSLSGALVDIQAMDREFADGACRAHKGMAEMAENLWACGTGEAIIELFEKEEAELRDYGLTITGHSLGAGTACLLNIKVHAEKLVGDRPVRCYAFAPPPTLYVCSSSSCSAEGDSCRDRIDAAIQNTTAYIHDNDAVPFLSVASTRRLAALLDAVDNETEHIWFWRRWKIFHEWAPIPQEIFDSVADAGATKTRAVDGECNLIIPARVVVWMKQTFAGGSFEAVGCDPAAVARGTIFVCQDMLSDHLPEQYEDALDALIGEKH